MLLEASSIFKNKRYFIFKADKNFWRDFFQENESSLKKVIIRICYITKRTDVHILSMNDNWMDILNDKDELGFFY